MKRCIEFISNLLHRFRADGRGSVAIVFSLSVIPILGLAALSIDYTRALTAQSRLNAAADAAVLGALGKSSNPLLSVPTQAAVQDYFNAQSGVDPSVVITNFSFTTTKSVTSLFVTVSYNASVTTTLANIIGIRSLPIHGSSTAQTELPVYVNFYLLLDNSPSMGLAATTGDIANMQALTPDQCAFACHQHSYNSYNQITGDDTSDYYHLAKNNNITTRIDVLRTATQNLTNTAMTSETIPNQFQMAVYTFSDTFQTISGLTTNLNSGSGSVQTLANNVDLDYAYQNQRDTQTSFDTALSKITSIIPTAGSGQSAATPQEWLFLVTDGVEDEPVKSASGSGDTPDNWTCSPAKSSKTCGVGKANTNVSNSLSGNVSSTRLITTMTPSLCTTLKNNGVMIAVLYTTYLPVPVNAFYNSWVAPISSTIPTNLQSCASPGFFFQVSPSGGIDAAMQAMFLAALSQARLTK